MKKLILVDINADMCIAWKAYFDGLPNVEIVKGKFNELPEFDCIVGAANSFGIMGAGVNLAIARFFSEDLVQRVQKRIKEDYLGEQPVGTSMIVETDSKKHPFLAHTPTMRVPMSIKHTDNVYLAMWSMLLAVRNHNQVAEKKINIVACSGLGTGKGQIPFTEAARQMALAYENYLNPLETVSMRHIFKHQSNIRFGGYDGFEKAMD